MDIIIYYLMGFQKYLPRLLYKLFRVKYNKFINCEIKSYGNLENNTDCIHQNVTISYEDYAYEESYKL